MLYKSRVERLQLSTTAKSRRLQITKDFIWGLKNSNSGEIELKKQKKSILKEEEESRASIKAAAMRWYSDSRRKY